MLTVQQLKETLNNYETYNCVIIEMLIDRYDSLECTGCPNLALDSEPYCVSDWRGPYLC